MSAQPHLGCGVHVEALGQDVGVGDEAHEVVDVALDAARHAWVLDLHGRPAPVVQGGPMHLRASLTFANSLSGFQASTKGNEQQSRVGSSESAAGWPGAPAHEPHTYKFLRVWVSNKGNQQQPRVRS